MDQATETCEVKVYIVTEGEYSAYRICGAFSSETKAREFLDAGGGDTIEGYSIDIWTPRMGSWGLWMDLATGNIIREQHTSSLDEPTENVHSTAWPDVQAIRIDVAHGDRERAVKIASEQFSRIKLHWEQAEKLCANNPYLGPYWFRKQDWNKGMDYTLSIARVLAGLDPLPTLPASIHGECVRMAITSASKQEIA